jgi:uncharacterized coiled-coil protein SlyX
MRYYNAMEAARILNISDKTVRRYVAKGKLTAKRTEFNEIAIPEDEIAHLLTELNEARAQFRQDSQGVESGLSSMSNLPGTIPLTDTTLTETIKELGKLQARVDVQDARIGELERRVAEQENTAERQAFRIAWLEKKVASLSIDIEHPVIDENAPVQPVPIQPLQNTTPKPSPLRTSTTTSSPIPADLPSGTLSASEFAAQIGMPHKDLDRYIRRGIRGEMIDVIEIPHATRANYTEKYLSPEQQTKAIDILKRHGKIK